MCAVTLLLLEKCHVDLPNSVVLFLLFGDKCTWSLFLILGITLNPILEEIFCGVSLFESIKFILERGGDFLLNQLYKSLPIGMYT